MPALRSRCDRGDPHRSTASMSIIRIHGEWRDDHRPNGSYERGANSLGRRTPSSQW
jgi:hypothetical protein